MTPSLRKVSSSALPWRDGGCSQATNRISRGPPRIPLGRNRNAANSVEAHTGGGYRHEVSHTSRTRKKLLHRVRRLGGQVRAIERALEQGQECGKILHTL